MLSAKYASLLACVILETLLILVIRYTKTRDHSGPPYLTSVTVASIEVFKLCLSFTLEFISSKNTQSVDKAGSDDMARLKLCTILKPMLIFTNRESFKLLVPALLYLFQNNLVFVALTNLSVPVYQVTSQGKLLTTAILSRIMLHKQISWMQYVAIAMLGLGVAVIHLGEHYAKIGDLPPAGDTQQQQNQILGLMAVLISCFTSSFAGVYFELVLKKSPTQLSVHCRNFHLASWSFLLVVFQIFSTDIDKVKQYGLFHGFDAWVVVVVIAFGMVGFVISMAIKYADTILKGFAMSIASVLSTLLSVPLFGARLTPSFLGGASMVIASVKMYPHFAVNTEDGAVTKVVYDTSHCKDAAVIRGA